VKFEGFEIDPDNKTRDMMVIACSYGFTTSKWEMQKYGAHIQTSEIPPSTDLICDQLIACKIVGEMGRQPKPVNSWLFFCYGHSDMADFVYNTIVINRHLCKPSYDIVEGHLKPVETNEYRLATMSLHDYKRRLQGQPATPDEVLIAGLGIKPWAWSKHYKPMFSKYLDTLKGIDIEGVSKVSIVVKSVLE